MADYSIVQKSLTPPLTATLEKGGAVQDLTGATVTVTLYNSDAETTYITRTCTITDAVNGKVEYDWVSGDTDVAGNYLGSFKAVFSDGSDAYFPDESYFTLTITPSLTGTTKPRPDYRSTADLIRDVRRYLDGPIRVARNKLASAIDTQTETVPLRYNQDIAVGTRIAIGLETMHVWQAAGTTLTVERGVDGTVPAQHGAGDVVLMGPQWTDSEILDGLNAELRALPPLGVYQTRTLTLSVSVDVEGYDLAADVLRVLDVAWQDGSDTTEWTPLQGWRLQRNAPTAQFPSGVALMLPFRQLGMMSRNNAVPSGTTRTVRVTYAAGFNPLATLFDDVVTVTGIPDTAVDILPLGAAILLGAGRPVQLVNTGAQPDPRRSGEVRVSDALNAWAALRQQHDQKVRDQADRLARQYPYRQPARRLMSL